jgi:hypothetical protein
MFREWPLEWKFRQKYTLDKILASVGATFKRIKFSEVSRHIDV